MVRYKSRYLLFNILYPTATTTTATVTSTSTQARSTSTCTGTGTASDRITFQQPSDPKTTTPSELATLLRESLTQQFGDWGSGVAGNLSVKYFSPATSTGIVRVGREHYRLVWAALTYIKDIRGRPCVIRVVHVSGTIKKAEIQAIKRAKSDILAVSAQAEGNEADDILIIDDDDGGGREGD